jgi:hypothetical protein
MRGTWGRESNLESIYNEIEDCSLPGLREDKVVVRRSIKKKGFFYVVTTGNSGPILLTDVDLTAWTSESQWRRRNSLKVEWSAATFRLRCGCRNSRVYFTGPRVGPASSGAGGGGPTAE